jgi:DNA repair protein RecO (recombination protein O)
LPERTLHVLILKRRDSGESDRRLTVLSQEAGVLDVTAKGARKSASILAGSSEPLSACILHIAEGKRNAYITQVQPVTSFPGLRTDYERLSFGLALTELAAAVLPHEQPAGDAFALLVTSLQYLEVHRKPIVALIWAQLKLLEMTGFMPSFAECAVTNVPIQESTPFVSPHAGGYVVNDRAGRYTDRVQTKAEVLYGITAMAELDEPPPNFRFAEETLRVLYPFWRAIAGYQLPANEAMLNDLHRPTE